MHSSFDRDYKSLDFFKFMCGSEHKMADRPINMDPCLGSSRRPLETLEQQRLSFPRHRGIVKVSKDVNGNS